MNRENHKRVYHEDQLVIRARRPNGNMIAQGKRVGRDCLLTQAERREYVLRGAVFAVKLIRDSRQVSLAEALNLLNRARGGSPLDKRRRRY